MRPVRAAVGAAAVALAAVAFLALRPKPPEVATLTADGLYWHGATPPPKGMTALPLDPRTDFVLSVKESFPNEDQSKARAFLAKAPQEFVLRAPGGHPVRARLDNSIYNSAWAKFEGFGLSVAPEDRKHLLPHRRYSLEVNQEQRDHRWIIDPSLTLSVP